MVTVADIQLLQQLAAGIAAELEPELFGLADAIAARRAVTAVKNAAATMEGLLAKRIADTGEWRRSGARSPEDDLARSTGTSRAKAKESLDTADRLRALPDTDTAARAGELSPEKAAVIADGAAADPSAEPRLLAMARTASLAELKEEVARIKAAADPDPEATYRRNRSERHLRIWADAAGLGKLFGQTTPDQMAVIAAAVEARTDELFQAARKSGIHESRGAYCIDALEQICAEWMGRTSSAPVEETADGESDASPAKAEPAAPATAKRPPYLGLVRIDHAALVRGWVEGEELCEITGMGPIPVRVARDLLGDAVLHLILTKGTAVASTVNIRRGPNVAQRIALLWTSPTCCVTGCPSRHTQVDHHVPWAAVKVTELSNLQALCVRDHDLKTTQGWEVVRADGDVLIVSPADPRHPQHRPPPRAPDDG